MEYKRLGKAGIRVSELSFGSWVTFSKQIGLREARALMREAFENGINFFDNAEVYADGESEKIMGEALRDFRREDLVISTKIFFGIGDDNPNGKGLSRKHLIEGTYNSLERMDLDYVDLLYCHRPDPETPIEETVLAMDYLVRSGLAFYWGTSEWSAEEIEQAHQAAKELHCIPPSMEQPQYNMLHRTRVEKEYASLYEKYGMGTTIWSPLQFGILTGKYNDGIPQDSRLASEEWLVPEDLARQVEIVKQLTVIADELECKMAQLALAWCLKNPNVSTVITGATRMSQLHENLDAVNVKEKLTDDVMTRIEQMLATYAPHT